MEEVLEHPYLRAYHEAEDEPVHKQLFDFSFEGSQDVDTNVLKDLILQEVIGFQMESI